MPRNNDIPKTTRGRVSKAPFRLALDAIDKTVRGPRRQPVVAVAPKDKTTVRPSRTTPRPGVDGRKF
jgi:hypothetical protein